MSRKHDRGSVSAEAILLAPLLIILMLFVVHIGRMGAAHLRLLTAADHAARAASQVHPRDMESVGRQVAEDNLRRSDVDCLALAIAVTFERAAQASTVRIDIECRLDFSGLRLLEPLDRALTATSTEVVDRWRVDS